MLYTIALTLIPDIPLSQQLELLRFGLVAEDIILRPDETLKDVNEKQRGTLIKTIKTHRTAALLNAQQEVEFCQQHGIQILTLNDSAYPYRLKECEDAPVVLFYKGNASLNAKYVISVVGTRRITEYGKQMCARFMEDLARLLPDTLVISGLAYGVDIHAQRGAMDNGLLTVGVVAHGLDRIYPSMHRNDAKRMVGCGGILTEFVRGTSPLPSNFLQRNRIVAGMADCVLVVESAEHGGSLVTAKIASSYNRTVFAVPGRINDTYSIGCNNLISRLQAVIAVSMEHIVKEMGWWDEVQASQNNRQLTMFTQEEMAGDMVNTNMRLSPKELLVFNALNGSDGIQPHNLATKIQLPLPEVRTLLFDMELSGYVRLLPGGFYILKK